MSNIVFKYSFPGASCSKCSNTILTHTQNQFDSKPNIRFLSFNFKLSEKCLEIELPVDTPYSIVQMQALLDFEAIGYQCIPDESEQDVMTFKWGDLNVWGASLGFGFGLILLLSSLGLFGIPLLLTLPTVVLSNAVLATIAWPFVQNAWYHFALSWKHQKYQNLFNMDTLFVFTGLLIITSSILSLWFPVFPLLLEAGFLIFGFRHLGAMIQAYLDEQVSPTRSLVGMFKNQKFEIEGENEPICGKFLSVGQVILVKKGQVLPVDGRVLSGSANLRDVLKAGSYLPLQDKLEGHVLEAGTEVMDGEVWLCVERDIANSRLANMDAAIQNIRGQQKPAAILLKAERWLQWFIPGMLFLALISGIWIGQVFGLALALKCVAAILVSACPCTLGFIIPMSLQMGAYKAKINDLVFQNSEALQLAAESKIVVVDYNGTLTKGEHQVGELQLLDEAKWDAQACYEIIDALETEMLKQRPHQSIGRMVKAKMQSMVGTESHIHIHAFEDFGFGCKILTPMGEWWFGNHQIFKASGPVQNDVHIEKAPQRLYLLYRAMQTAEIYCVGHLDIQDELRQGASQFIQNLQETGKKVRICTGADQFTANDMVNHLPIKAENIQAEQTPEGKAQYIQSLRNQYPDEVIAMIGDGANDSAALAASDIKIWLKNNNQSSEFEDFMKGCANIVVESGDLLGICRGLEVARQTFMAIEQNLWISFAYNFFMLSLACGALLAFGFALHPAMGVSMMILQSVCLVLNNYRIAELPLENRSTLTVN